MIHKKPQKLLFATTLIAIAILMGCSREAQPTAATPEVLRNVSIVTVQRATVADVLEVVGTVHAAQTSQLASQAMGNIVEMRAREGDRVQRGQLLAVIDDAQARASVERATAASAAAGQEIAAADSDLTLAQATLKRYQTLYDRKSASPQEFDEVKARYQAATARRAMAGAGEEQARAALAQSRTALEYTRIRAPFDGVVTERKVDTGTLASPGLPVFTIEDVRHYRLEANVNESDLRYVRLGQQVPVVLDALGNAEIKGKVVQIVPAIDPSSRSFVVKIEVTPDNRIRSGLFGRAQFTRGERQSLLLPQTAVVQRGQLQGIYVVDQNKIVTLRYVTLGKPSGAQVEALAGLQDGERIVSQPGDLDLGGKRIEGQ
jgi:RND family efflux transporter MFP subunit